VSSEDVCCRWFYENTDNCWGGIKTCSILQTVCICLVVGLVLSNRRRNVCQKDCSMYWANQERHAGLPTMSRVRSKIRSISMYFCIQDAAMDDRIKTCRRNIAVRWTVAYQSVKMESYCVSRAYVVFTEPRELVVIHI